MIDVSEYIWKLDMLKLWIAIEIDMSTVYEDMLRLYNETGCLFFPNNKPSTEDFEEFLHYSSFYYSPKQ